MEKKYFELINVINFARIIEWLHKYMSSYSNAEWVNLYESKIKEELEETNTALQENNLVEFLDWCIDLFWVIKWYEYFWWDIFWLQINPFEILFNNIKFDSEELLKISLINDLINVIADSNFTKELSWNEIIKWKDFINPIEWLKEIITKYNIRLITE